MKLSLRSVSTALLLPSTSCLDQLQGSLLSCSSMVCYHTLLGLSSASLRTLLRSSTMLSSLYLFICWFSNTRSAVTAAALPCQALASTLPKPNLFTFTLVINKMCYKLLQELLLMFMLEFTHKFTVLLCLEVTSVWSCDLYIFTQWTMDVFPLKISLVGLHFIFFWCIFIYFICIYLLFISRK